MTMLKVKVASSRSQRHKISSEREVEQVEAESG